MSDLDAKQRDRFLSDLRAAKEASKSGVSLGRARAAVTVWEIWQDCCADLGIDPFLEAMQDKVPILQVFAQRVRTGELAAGGHPILARSVEDYIRHVAQTFLGVGANDPRKKPGENDLDFRIKRLQAAWKKQDPPPHRVNPVPSAALPSPASVGFRLGFYQSHRRHIYHCLFLLSSPRRVPNLLPSRCMMSASSLGKSTSRSHHNNPLWFQSPQHPTPHPRKRKPASPPRPRLPTQNIVCAEPRTSGKTKIAHHHDPECHTI